MPYNPDIHDRRSIRLKGYDYAQSGAYFVTICTHQRQHIFGEIINGEMHPNPLGQVIMSSWQAIPHHFLSVLLDEFILMPNHFHGIIIINGTLSKENSSLAAIVRNFKSISTRKINQITRSSGAPVWQKNYYETIIRDETALENIRQYIVTNPLNWESDRENLSNLL